MSRKINYREPWTPPAPDEVRRKIESIGGAKTVCLLLRKNKSTISRWQKDNPQNRSAIDYANWWFLCVAGNQKAVGSKKAYTRCNGVCLETVS